MTFKPRMAKRGADDCRSCVENPRLLERSVVQQRIPAAVNIRLSRTQRSVSALSLANASTIWA